MHTVRADTTNKRKAEGSESDLNERANKDDAGTNPADSMSDDALAAPQPFWKLPPAETDRLRSLLKSTLRIDGSDPRAAENAGHLLNYAFAMIANGRNVQYVREKLVSMEMDVCNDEAAERLGKALGRFLRELDGGGSKRSEPGRDEGGRDGDGGNALAMSGALGSSREGRGGPGRDFNRRGGREFDGRGRGGRDDRGGPPLRSLHGGASFRLRPQDDRCRDRGPPGRGSPGRGPPRGRGMDRGGRGGRGEGFGRGRELPGGRGAGRDNFRDQGGRYNRSGRGGGREQRDGSGGRGGGGRNMSKRRHGRGRRHGRSLLDRRLDAGRDCSGTRTLAATNGALERDIERLQLSPALEESEEHEENTDEEKLLEVRAKVIKMEDWQWKELHEKLEGMAASAPTGTAAAAPATGTSSAPTFLFVDKRNLVEEVVDDSTGTAAKNTNKRKVEGPESDLNERGGKADTGAKIDSVAEERSGQMMDGVAPAVSAARGSQPKPLKVGDRVEDEEEWDYKEKNHKAKRRKLANNKSSVTTTSMQIDDDVTSTPQSGSCCSEASDNLDNDWFHDGCGWKCPHRQPSDRIVVGGDLNFAEPLKNKESGKDSSATAPLAPPGEAAAKAARTKRLLKSASVDSDSGSSSDDDSVECLGSFLPARGGNDADGMVIARKSDMEDDVEEVGRYGKAVGKGRVKSSTNNDNTDSSSVKLSEQVTPLHTANTEAEQLVVGLKEAKEGADKKAAALETKLKEEQAAAAATATDLENKLEEATGSNAKLTEQVTALNTVREETVKLLKEKEAALGEANAKITSLSEEVTEVKSQLSGLSGEATELRDAKVSAKERVAALEGELESATSANIQLTDRVASLGSSVEKHAKETKKLETKTSSLIKERDQAKSRVHDLEMELTRQREALDHIKTEKERIGEELSLLKREKKCDDEKYHVAMQQAKVDMHGAKNQLAHLQNELGKLQLEKKRVVERLLIEKKHVDGQLAAKDERIKDMQRNSKSVDRIKNTLSNAKQEIADLKSKLRETRSQNKRSQSPSNSDSPGKVSEDDQKLREALKGAIVTETPDVSWDDVAGLNETKDTLKETALLPMMCPQLFRGKRKPFKGILLYGPPGTGKTYLVKALATEANSTIFSVSSSDLVSQWIGESERLIKNLFQMAREAEGGRAIIFIDEVDSLCSSRSEGEGDCTRRIKTEFLVQMDGMGKENGGVLVLGATNRPWELDTAIRRRFEKRLYIPLPEAEARSSMVKIHLGNEPHSLTESDFDKLGQMTDGASGDDIRVLVKKTLHIPVRWCQHARQFLTDGEHFVPCKDNPNCAFCPPEDDCPRCGAKRIKMWDMSEEEMKQVKAPGVCMEDFENVLKEKPHSTVSAEELEDYAKWTTQFGENGS